ncbi:hypothetical protein H2199_006172 [Coniosporium tulheliwenetii]|uniref:Uncharacterized protein n=1 Tax=Coniosporium tulheliwenetii TaxID=3383036 RepID=A0ACC2YY49_9PEZI|nr:hypothetical protein H2199_006172 [Cladosporium sp. JES 115]
MGVIVSVVQYIAPVFLITSPITSYADQIYTMHRTRSSAGFSLDIPLIMLVASILKVYYWLTAHFALPLLLQSFLMIAIQLLLLHVALSTRPAAPSTTYTPFLPPPSPWNPISFWRWRPAKPYWLFLLYLTLALLALQVLLGPYPAYSTFQGYLALGIEATLPLPQLAANQRRRSVKGFRASVLANWLLGDAFKMVWFFTAPAGEVPGVFKACGVFQAACDVLLGVQAWVFGDGVGVGDVGVW